MHIFDKLGHLKFIKSTYSFHFVTYGQLMEVGRTGQIGDPVVLRVAVDLNSVVALAPILLRLMVEHSAVGTRPSLNSAMMKLVHVSNNENIYLIPYNLSVRSRIMYLKQLIK